LSIDCNELGDLVLVNGGGGWTVNAVDAGSADVDLSVEWTPSSSGLVGRSGVPDD
jgi:hypothetical protein